MTQKLLLLGLAGALGAMLRYGLAGWVQQAAGGEFPWGTLAVNVLGCFLAGAFWAFSENRLGISGETRAIVLVGFLGAFTTFSAFMLETSHLLRDTEWLMAMANVCAQNVAGIVALFAGLFVGRAV